MIFLRGFILRRMQKYCCCVDLHEQVFLHMQPRLIILIFYFLKGVTLTCRTPPKYKFLNGVRSCNCAQPLTIPSNAVFSSKYAAQLWVRRFLLLSNLSLPHSFSLTTFSFQHLQSFSLISGILSSVASWWLVQLATNTSWYSSDSHHPAVTSGFAMITLWLKQPKAVFL